MINQLQHPQFSRRTMLQAGSISLLGLGLPELNALRAQTSKPVRQHQAVIFIFLSGGLAQHESFDMKPDAPDNIRGEFKPISTKTTGIQICEHLPELAKRSSMWSLVRTISHRTNNHSDGHLFMLTGRSQLPPGFDPSKPKETDWPSIAAVAGVSTAKRHNLPPAVVLPDRIVHNTGRVIPGQFAGLMGRQRDPWFLEASAFEPKAYGAFPSFEFDHQDRPRNNGRQRFQIPDLSLPQGVDQARLDQRLNLLQLVDQQRKLLDQTASQGGMSSFRSAAVSLLTDPKVRRAFDIEHQPKQDLERYGNHSFGWSLLMAARLVETGVNLVQVNLGNNETWDTHGNAFPHLKNNLLPPMDRSVSALLDDLNERGLLDSTLVVMAGEFGRTPRISTLPSHYKHAGRDHWGATQSILLAGGGVQGGRVIGVTDKNGGYPTQDPQSPEQFAATIYHALGIPKDFMWHDTENRPHHVYHGEPIRGLS